MYIYLIFIHCLVKYKIDLVYLDCLPFIYEFSALALTVVIRKYSLFGFH